MTLYSYPITIEKERSRYYAYTEDFPGVYGAGSSLDQAKRSLLEAMRLYIDRCRETHKLIPASRTIYAETVTLAVE
jgi:predicted RNase H-like HicB family nuclease